MGIMETTATSKAMAGIKKGSIIVRKPEDGRWAKKKQQSHYGSAADKIMLLYQYS